MAVRSLAQSSLVEPFSNGSMLAGYSGNAFHHLETVRLSSGAATVEFTNLARYSDFQHLQIRIVARTNRASAFDNAAIRFNGDTGSNYNWHQLFGEGSGSGLVRSTAGVSQTSVLASSLSGASATSNGFAAGVTDILDPFETTKFTTVRTLTGYPHTTDSDVALRSGAFRNTAAVSSITLISFNAASFVAGSRFSLYGIKTRA